MGVNGCKSHKCLYNVCRAAETFHLAIPSYRMLIADFQNDSRHSGFQTVFNSQRSSAELVSLITINLVPVLLTGRGYLRLESGR